MNKFVRSLGISSIALYVVLLGACNKKVAKAVTPQPLSPAVPTASLTANPSVIGQGQSTQLTWKTGNAEAVSINGIGTVATSGSRIITPDSSMTYTLTAIGSGGIQEASARVTVNPTATKNQTESSPTEEELFDKNVKDLFFDFDKYDLRSDQTPVAHGDSAFLAQHPDLKVVIEGHCDDRGSEEYNLALGDSRANALRQSLITEGVSADRIKIVSYGKEHPFCSDEDEGCWHQNRRDHISLQ